MKDHFCSKDSEVVRWQQRGAELLCQASQRRLLPLDRQPEALVMIPIKAAQPAFVRQSRERALRD